MKEGHWETEQIEHWLQSGELAVSLKEWRVNDRMGQWINDWITEWRIELNGVYRSRMGSRKVFFFSSIAQRRSSQRSVCVVSRGRTTFARCKLNDYCQRKPTAQSRHLHNDFDRKPWRDEIISCRCVQDFFPRRGAQNCAFQHFNTVFLLHSRVPKTEE
jgi:hypothetical protein